MKVLRLADLARSPLLQEEDLRHGLRDLAPCDCSNVRLTVTERVLFVDGFVASVDEKLMVETVCRKLAPDTNVVNRLRIAAGEGDSQPTLDATAS